MFPQHLSSSLLPVRNLSLIDSTTHWFHIQSMLAFSRVYLHYLSYAWLDSTKSGADRFSVVGIMFPQHLSSSLLPVRNLSLIDSPTHWFHIQSMLAFSRVYLHYLSYAWLDSTKSGADRFSVVGIMFPQHLSSSLLPVRNLSLIDSTTHWFHIQSMLAFSRVYLHYLSYAWLDSTKSGADRFSVVGIMFPQHLSSSLLPVRNLSLIDSPTHWFHIQSMLAFSRVYLHYLSYAWLDSTKSGADRFSVVGIMFPQHLSSSSLPVRNLSLIDSPTHWFHIQSMLAFSRVYLHYLSYAWLDSTKSGADRFSVVGIMFPQHLSSSLLPVRNLSLIDSTTHWFHIQSMLAFSRVYLHYLSYAWLDSTKSGADRFSVVGIMFPQHLSSSLLPVRNLSLIDSPTHWFHIQSMLAFSRVYLHYLSYAWLDSTKSGADRFSVVGIMFPQHLSSSSLPVRNFI